MRSAPFLLAALGLLTSGCFTTRLQDRSFEPGLQQDEWRSFFFWGLVGKAKIDVREFCPSGEVYEVATGTNAGTAIVTTLTLGIYSPEKIYVRCADGAATVAMGLDAEGRPSSVEVREGDRVRVGSPVAGVGPGAFKVALHDAKGGGK